MSDLKLVDAGAHSVGVNNSNARQFVSATPEFKITSPLEFTSIAGTASAPTMQHAQSGKISAGDELLFKPTGSNTLAAVTVGGVSESPVSGSVTPGATDWEGSPSLFNLASGSASNNSSSGYINLKKVFSGDFTITLTINDLHNGGYTEYLGLALASSYTPGTTGPSTGYHIAGGGGSGVNFNICKSGGQVVAGTDYTAARVLEFKRAGSTFTIKYNGATLYTDASCIANDLVMWFGTNVGQANSPNISGISYPGVTGYTSTLSGLSPAQSVLPEKVFKIRADKTKELMHIARLIQDATPVDADFASASAIASMVYAAGPQITVTGSKVTFADDATKKRLALRLRGDFTTVGARAKSAKLYTEERTA